MKRSRTNSSEMKEHRERVKLAEEQRSAKAAGQAKEDADDAEAGRSVLLAVRPMADRVMRSTNMNCQTTMMGQY